MTCNAAIDRVLALGPARDDADHLLDVVPRDQPEDFVRKVGLEDEYDLVNGVGGFEAPERVDEQRHAGKLYHLLGAVSVHARADAGCGNYGYVESRFSHYEPNRGYGAELWRGPAAARPSSV